MKFEELYKKSRSVHSNPFNEDAMWENIENRLKKPRKKRKYLFFWFFGSLISIAIISLYFNENEIPNSDSKSYYTHDKNTNKSFKNQVTGNNNKARENYSVHLEKQEISDSKKGNFIDQSLQSSIQNFDKRQNSKDETIQKYDQIDHDFISKNDSHRLNEYIIDDLEIDQKETTDTNITGIDKSQKTIDRPWNNFIIPIPILPNPEVISKNNVLARIQSQSSVQTSFQNNEDSRINEFQFLANIGFFNPVSTIWERDPTTTTWSELHESSKRSSISYQLSGKIKYAHRSGLFFGSGFTIRNISEWYDGTETIITPFEAPSDTARFTNIGGVKQYWPGQNTSLKVERTHYQTPVKRLYLDLPIFVGYQKSIGKWDASLSLTYNLNLAHQYNGRSYSEVQLLLDQNQLNERQIYKSSSVNSINFGISISYSIHPETSVGLFSNYWYQLSSSLNENNSIGERYRGVVYGLQVKKVLKN